MISQESLTAFRTAIAERTSDPYLVLLHSNKLPLSLIRDKEVAGRKEHQAKSANEIAPFPSILGPKSQRKRVQLVAGSFTEMAEEASKSMEKQPKHWKPAGEGQGLISRAVEPIFNKGQSKRIWNEMYKVLDSSDVIIQVLDARDPLGTRCHSVEEYLRTEAPH